MGKSKTKARATKLDVNEQGIATLTIDVEDSKLNVLYIFNRHQIGLFVIFSQPYSLNLSTLE